ncbi:MAG: RNA polymerase subunit sigma [Gemmatimonas sp.]|jgi:RNA polymerase sigma-70 factor (ECF subfamily)|uniref:RNA polymerase sigma factor n=1 Tax=Gemmatimonas sp. UBA7669 TaxID=1946568 RepID=UPI0025C6ADB1|nr:sigma-70 family RNA polymerase sigma factor [Gemmatimonas sp. UBA7669]MBA3917023.1 RNA polymerase subunit sigma [Gemmatimonas sp.]
MAGAANPAEHPDFESSTLPYLPRLLQYARRLTGNDAEAEDLVQSTYLNALRGWHTFQPGSDVARWLFTVCRNTFFRSRRKKDDSVSLESPELESLAGAREAATFLGQLGDDWQQQPDLAAAIDTAIAALPDSLRVLVMMIDVEGYSYEEAAQAEGIPVGTVRSRLYRARRQLQQALAQYAEDLGLRTGGQGA